MKLSSITEEELARASGAARPDWAGLRFDPIGGAAGGALGGMPGAPAPGHDIGVPYEPSPSPTMPTDVGGYPPPYDLGQWGTPYPGWEDGGSQLGGAAWPAESDPSTLLPQDPGIQLPGDPGIAWPPGFDPSTIPGDPILDPQPGIGDPPEPGIADPWTNPEAPNTNDPSQAGDSVDDPYTGIDDEDGPIGMPDPGTGEPTPSEPIGMPEPPNSDLEGTQGPVSDWGQDETGGGYGGGEYGGGDYGGDYDGGDYGGDYGGGDYGGGGDY